MDASGDAAAHAKSDASTGCRSDQTCVKGGCVGAHEGPRDSGAPDTGPPSVCSVGTKRCTGKVPETCGANRQWQSGTACSFVCDAGACTGVCNPGAEQCTGKIPETCDATGKWTDGAPCTYVCDPASGACGGECTPATKTCNNNTARVCDATGHYVDTVCPNICSSGA
jgi:hypothetical protein